MPLLDAFSTAEALTCGNLVQAAYAQYERAVGPSGGSWSLPAGFKAELGFSAKEQTGMVWIRSKQARQE